MAAPASADPGAGFAVTVADLGSTSAAFARQHDVAATATGTASRALAPSAGMAGHDPVLAAWRGRYDAVAAITWLAAGAMVSSLHDTAGAEVAGRLPLGPGPRIVALLAGPVVASGYVLIARDRYLTGLHELTTSLGPDLEDRLRRALTTELPAPADPRGDLQVGMRAADVGEVLGTGLRGSR